MDLLGLVLVVALGLWGGRKLAAGWKKRRAAAARAKTPGYSADAPLLLTSGRVIDDAVKAARCLCGGRLQSLGETPRMGLRVTRCRCVECDEETDLYFSLPHLLN